MSFILLIAGVKGGCGKSTLTASIAVEMQQRFPDKTLCVVNADTQETAARFCQDRHDSKLPHIQCVSLYGNIAAQLKDLSKHYDIIICDPAGRDSVEMRSAMVVADMLLTPSKASQPDLDTFAALSEIVAQVEFLNPDLLTHVVINMASTNPKVSEVHEARDYLAEYPEFTVCDHTVSDRKGFRDSISMGMGITEYTDPKARLEVENLVDELLGALSNAKAES